MKLFREMWAYLRNNRVVLFYSLVATILLALFFTFRLSSLVPAFAPAEIQSWHVSQSLREIYNNPVNAPYHVLQWLPMKLNHHSILIARLISVFIGIIAVVIFYYLARTRYSDRVSLLATFMFATSSGILFAARLGAPFVLQLMVLGLLLIPFIWIHPNISRNLSVYIITGIVSFCLYIPGVFWIILLGCVAFWKTIYKGLRRVKTLHLVFSGLLLLVFMSHLVWIGAHNTSVFRELLGLPAQLPDPKNFILDLVHGVRAIVHSNYGRPEFTLAGAPVLSVAESALAILGFVSLWQVPRTKMTFAVTGIFVIGFVLSALNGPVQTTIILPALYMFVTAGIFYMLNIWRTVFPRNPIASNFAVTMLVLLVSTALIFQLRTYFVAWPHSKNTITTFDSRHP